MPDQPQVPDEPPSSSLAKRVRSFVIPRLDELATRLRAARHKTLVDDRLDDDEARIRFRLVPWKGPFEEAPTVSDSVLEIAVDEGGGVVVRYWLDGTADEPSVESHFDDEKIGARWCERVLLDFVELTLAAA
ncbi:MAG: hypothetical protein R3304_07605 [Longimicrobiales bacterium]|nr:hypothetical protein [Longimicrobiales bacterium]